MKCGLLSQYALSPYELKNNHVAIVEGWTLLCAYIFGLIEPNGLPDNYWRPSYELIIRGINEQLFLLKEEVLSRNNYIEGDALGDGDVIYKAPNKTWFWGESATPLFILMCLLLSEYRDEYLSNLIIRDRLWEIMMENNIREGKGIPDPYYRPKEVIGSIFNMPEFEID